LTTLLRDTYGYEGMVVSDWDDLNRMITNHDYAPDFETATEMAINAGVDMYMIGNGGDAPGPVQFIDTVVSLVEDGAIPMERIDEAVRRILELKADLGLFEQPTVDESRIETVLGGAQETAETMAKESMVLLKNTDDTLPLSGDESVLLTGPGVDSNGNNTRALMQHGGWTLGWQGASAGGPFPRQNLLEAELRARVGSLTHVPTSYENTTWWAGEGDGENQQSDENGNFDFTAEQRSRVESAGPESDVVVVVLGEGTHNEGFGDRDELVLDESQQALLDTVVESTDDSTPIIGVMLAGSPRGSPETFSQLDALLFAGQPGSDGGVAIAETLVGEYNPSGKLPFSWPENVGTTPVQYTRYDPTSTGGTDNTAIYEYGHGLSYTDFEYGSVSVTQPTVGNPANQSEVTVSVEVTNTGRMAGEHIVEVFNTQSYGSVLQPRRRLLGYERVSLGPGELTTVDVTVDLTALEVVPGDVLGLGPKVVEAGEYELTVGQDGPTATLTVQNTASITDPDPVPGLPDGSGSTPGRGNSGNNGNGNNTSRDPTMEDVVDLLDEVRGRS
jgi:beta-glucosidase